MKAMKKAYKTIPKGETAKAAGRVAIAKDVLAQLKTGRFKATPGKYVETNIRPSKLEAGTQLCDVLKAMPCRICAKGAIFVSMLDRYNDFKVTDRLIGASNVNQFSICESSFFEYVARLFGKEMFDKLEAYFEGNGDVDDDADPAIRFATSRVPEARLVAMMQNIISNNGEFVPEQLTAK